MSSPHEHVLRDLREKLAKAKAEVSRIEAAIAQMEAIYGPTPHSRTRFANRTFYAAVREILSDGPKSTDEIVEALTEGGYQSLSSNFRSNVVAQLSQQRNAGRLTKLGERQHSRWALAGAVPGHQDRNAGAA